MSGHSHWATIRRKKGAVDSKRGQLFSKLARAITMAARSGGGDPDTNIGLKYALDKARQNSMPKDNIDRAIKKGTGELEGAAQYEGVTYEAIAPGGVFILIEGLTDNRNRTASEIRKMLELKNARLGSVAWAFEPKGIINVAGNVPEDQLMELALELGAEDIQRVGESYQVTTMPTDLEAVRRGLVEKGITVESHEATQLPKTSVSVDEETGRKLMALLGDLEDHEDVQNVYSNMDLPESLMAEMAKG